MLTAEARVDSQRVRQGGLRDTDFTNLARAAGVLQGCPVWIDDTPSLSLLEMRSKARRLKAENDIKLWGERFIEALTDRVTPQRISA